MRRGGWLVFLALLGGCRISVVFAQVYRCTSETGAVEFREWPCQTSLEKSVILPYQSKKTDPQAVSASVEGKTTTAQAAVYKKGVRLKKRAEEAALKVKRRQDRCVKTQEKIKLLNNQLRSGCKPRRCNRLKEQLNHFEIMKGRYCQNG